MRKASYRSLIRLFGFILLLPFLSAMPGACIKHTEQHSDTAVSILFVGNSLTYSHQLPEKVQQIARSKGRTIQTTMLALPDYALVDHLAEGKVQQLIASGKYTYVVVQQGPSSQAEGRKMLLDAAVVLKELCAKYSVQLSFFMVWPAHQNYHLFDGVIHSYTQAATMTQAILCPVGAEWKKYIDHTGDLSYYDTDGFHPSEKGSQVAAAIIYDSLF